MNAPEPVDERPTAVPVEIRGGDHDEDFMNQPLPFSPPLPGERAGACGPDCGCADEIE